MVHICFEKPVRISFGKKGKSRLVGSVGEAIYCLKSDKWRQPGGAMHEAAQHALQEVRMGRITSNAARIAFEMAAREAGVLVKEHLLASPQDVAA